MTDISNSQWLSEVDSQSLYGHGDLPLLLLQSPLCRAVISLQGAQLLSFTDSANSEAGDWLWLSPLASLESGKAIRGGIPVCAPWFGVNRRDASLPKHGFVRNKPWQLRNFSENANGEVELHFGYQADAADKALWPADFELRLSMRLGNAIEQELTFVNNSPEPLPFSWALHSYFATALADTQVGGLQYETFLDATDDFQPKQEEQPFGFEAELDRVYERQVGAQQLLVSGKPRLSISGYGSPTVVVWNPGAELAEQMADVQSGYRDYVCIERGAAFADEYQVPAGGTATGNQKVVFVK